ncbi:1,3-propanediol dehydrogenase [Bacillaceae bacterium SAOS 7]|nr:1,3-propanediol dehydrogenase [Bacillaceae bacterium SAOS 7]
MNSFEFLLPTQIVMEKGVRSKTGHYLKENSISKVLIITDLGVKQAGLLKDVYQSLKENEINYEEFNEVKPNPRADDCDHAASMFQNKEIDGLLAIGGGSVMDTAKAISILLTHDGQITDFEGEFPTKNEVLPIVCIPTTAGTGSEVTFFSVITDLKRKYKLSILDYKIGPKLALLDPDITASLPSTIAASTGMDALTHAIEAYTSRVANPITDGLALHAVRLISKNIEKAIHEKEEEARSNMLIGSLIAGIAFGNSDIGSVHCISESVGGLYDTPHGIANAIFLPYVFRHNIDSSIDRHADIGYALGANPAWAKEKVANEAVNILFKLSESLGIPRLREIEHVDPKDFDEIAEKSKRNISDSSNAKKMTVESYKQILQEAYRG